MNGAVQLLSELYSRGVSVSLDGGRLLCKAPKNAITPDLRQRLSDSKTEIIEFLTSCKTTAPASVRRAEDSETFPLSRAQQRLWIFAQVNPDSAAYNTALPIRLSGAIDLIASERALFHLLNRHDVLRATFVTGEDGPVVRLKSSEGWGLSHVDVGGYSLESRRERALQLATVEAQTPFDLAEGPLFRATLYKVDPAEHLLLLTLHHIVSDGWSLSIVVKEYAALYEAYVAGKPSPLEALPTQYADYVRWEQQWEATEAASSVEYWKQKLNGASPGVALPSFRIRPSIQTYKGRRFRGALSLELIERLRRLSAEHRVTLFMTLLAAFDALLYRYTGMEDIVVGSPVTGRNRVEVEELIGLFVNQLPMRTDLSGDPRFIDLLVRVRETAVGAYANGELPFDRLLQELKISREPNSHPLFKIVFALQNFRQETVSTPHFEMSLEEIEIGITRLDLNLEVYPSPSDYRCEYEYSTDLFGEEFIRQFHTHFVNLLNAVVSNPATRISELSLLSESELYQIVHKWNETTEEIPAFTSVHEWFEAQAASTPSKIAIKTWSEELTYAELSRKSSDLAQRLMQKGVQRGSVVALLLERSPRLLIALLGILKAGGSYLPLDPAIPRERLLFTIQDSQTQYVVTESALETAFEDLALHVVFVDCDAGVSTVDRKGQPEITRDDLSYAIYTSGSTGVPKAVNIPHGAFLNLMHSVSKAPGLKASDTFLAVSSPSFDIASFELLAPLLVGACVVILDRLSTSDPARLTEAISRFHVTAMFGTPSFWKMMIEFGWTGQPGLNVMCGGEALPKQLAAELQRRCNTLWNMYGPTETTVWSLIQLVQKTDSHIFVGRPIGNTRIYILDGKGNPTPIGVPGELYIGGLGVASGYRNQPELTEKRFVKESFSDRSQNRMYKTGDLARYHPDGKVELLGRLDRQVKLRGYRIELGEIEAVLERHPAVRGAIVIGSETNEDATLVTYVLGEESKVSVRELKEWVRRTLPRYMIPSTFMYLEEFPLMAQGKVDLASLPKAARAADTEIMEVNETATPLERQILRVWQELLQLERIGLSDQIFDLGAHSLLVVKAWEKLQKQLDVTLSVANIFEYPTVASLAQFIETQRSLSRSSQPQLVS